MGGDHTSGYDNIGQDNWSEPQMSCHNSFVEPWETEDSHLLVNSPRASWIDDLMGLV